MFSHEIPRESWPAFLDRFSREHGGSRVMVEALAPDRGRHLEARGLPLDGVTVDPSGSACEIVVMVGRRPGAHLTHRVTDPVSVIVEEAEDTGILALRIVSGGDEETVVRLRGPVESSDEGDLFFR